MTKTERADILLDAIGFIGEDIVAEASGMSSVLQIPSKLKLNLMVMRRLLVATICLVLVSTLTPLSVYIYNNYIVPAVTPPDTTENEVTYSESDGEEFAIPEGYEVNGYIKFEMLASSEGEEKKVSAYAFTLSNISDGSRALFLEIKSFDGSKVTDTALFPGYCIMAIDQLSSLNELVIFNTSLEPENTTLGYADIAKYYVENGKLKEADWIGIRHANFDLSSEDSVNASRMSVFNMFMTLSSEIESSNGKLLIIDTYTSDKDILHHPDEKIGAPNITQDRKDGKRTWSLDRICDLFGYAPPVITEKEPIPDITLENGLVLRYIETDDGNIFYGVTGCSSEAMTELRIPNEYNGIPVTVLDTNALSVCRAETIIFPDSLTMFNKQKLGADVKRVVIECNKDTYLTIGIFRGSMIKEAIFTGDMYMIPNEMFYDCTELENVVFPETLTLICEGAFYNCTSLREVNFPQGLRSIQADGFIGCESIKSIILPEGFESIGDTAFAGCTSATEIYIPSTLKKIPSNTFRHHGCEVLTVPEGVEYIEGGALSGEKMRVLYMPRSLTFWDKNFLFTDELAIESVYYNGTKAEFAENVLLPQAGKNNYTIICTDGEIRIEKFE